MLLKTKNTLLESTIELTTFAILVPMSWQKTPKAGVKWRQNAACLGANAGTRNEESKTKSNKFIYLEKKKELPHHLNFMFQILF